MTKRTGQARPTIHPRPDGGLFDGALSASPMLPIAASVAGSHAGGCIRGGCAGLDRNRPQRDILIRSPSMRGVAEEARGAYKEVRAVVDAAAVAGLARKATLSPTICVKG